MQNSDRLEILSKKHLCLRSWLAVRPACRPRCSNEPNVRSDASTTPSRVSWATVHASCAKRFVARMQAQEEPCSAPERRNAVYMQESLQLRSSQNQPWRHHTAATRGFSKYSRWQGNAKAWNQTLGGRPLLNEISRNSSSSTSVNPQPERPNVKLEAYGSSFPNARVPLHSPRSPVLRRPQSLLGGKPQVSAPTDA